MSTDQKSNTATEYKPNTWYGCGEEPTRPVILSDGRDLNIPISWTTALACQQLRQRFNLVGGGIDIGICAVMESEDIQIGIIRPGQLYFRDYDCLTYVNGEIRALFIYPCADIDLRHLPALPLATSRIGHLVLQGVKALIRKHRLLKKKNSTGWFYRY